MNKRATNQRRRLFVLFAAGCLLSLTSRHVVLTDAMFVDTAVTDGNTFSTAGSFGCSTQTVVADADAYVDSGAPTTNYGTLTSTRSAGGADQHRALIHFTLPALNGCTLYTATLKLNASTGSTDGVLRTIDVYRAASTWSEAGVTWNDQPSTTGVAVAGIATSGLMTFDVTTAVLGMYSGTAGDTSFIVRYTFESGGGEWYTTWTSRESTTDKPILEITYII